MGLNSGGIVLFCWRSFELRGGREREAREGRGRKNEKGREGERKRKEEKSNGGTSGGSPEKLTVDHDGDDEKENHRERRSWVEKRRERGGF